MVAVRGRERRSVSRELLACAHTEYNTGASVPLYLQEAFEDPTLQREPPFLTGTSTSVQLALTAVTFLHFVFIFYFVFLFLMLGSIDCYTSSLLLVACLFSPWYVALDKSVC